MIGRLAGLDRRTSRLRADELLDRFGLAAAAARRVAAYSGGMRRRLDLAASIVSQPEVLFLDEPTTGLDPSSRLELSGVVGELVAAGVTVFLTTQYLEEADRLADRIAVLDGGRIVAEGTAEELKRRVAEIRLELKLQPHAPFDELLGRAALAPELRSAPADHSADRDAPRSAARNTGPIPTVDRPRVVRRHPRALDDCRQRVVHTPNHLNRAHAASPDPPATREESDAAAGCAPAGRSVVVSPFARNWSRSAMPAAAKA